MWSCNNFFNTKSLLKERYNKCMQTFIVSTDPRETARLLDYRRLGKQRVEAIQIARSILNLSEGKGWSNHPAVKMWRSHVRYLVYVYLPAMIDEWEYRGYNGPKCKEHLQQLQSFLPYSESSNTPPEWITPELICSHQSNLIRKDKEFYSEKFPDVLEDLEYVWPV